MLGHHSEEDATAVVLSIEVDLSIRIKKKGLASKEQAFYL